MTFAFKRAERTAVPLLIGLSGGTGSGKTKSGLEIATGLSGDKPFAVIDTETGRAKHYADEYAFDHGDLKPPFTPARYLEAILAAEAAGYPAIMVDSMSHEWAGEGGCLDMHEDELQRLAGNDWAKRERVAMLAWVNPKGEHKRMMNRLLQLRSHLVLCFRAEPKVEIVKNPQTGKTEIVEKKSLVGLNGWVPITEKMVPFELTLSALLMAEHPGEPLYIKVQQQHRPMMPTGWVITSECGVRLAQWAAGADPALPWMRRMEAAPNVTDVKNVFSDAWAALKGNNDARARAKATYDSRMAALSTPVVDVTKPSEELDETI